MLGPVGIMVGSRLTMKVSSHCLPPPHSAANELGAVGALSPYARVWPARKVRSKMIVSDSLLPNTRVRPPVLPVPGTIIPRSTITEPSPTVGSARPDG